MLSNGKTINNYRITTINDCTFEPVSPISCENIVDPDSSYQDAYNAIAGSLHEFNQADPENCPDHLQIGECEDDCDFDSEFDEYYIQEMEWLREQEQEQKQFEELSAEEKQKIYEDEKREKEEDMDPANPYHL